MLQLILSPIRARAGRKMRQFCAPAYYLWSKSNLNRDAHLIVVGAGIAGASKH